MAAGYPASFVIESAMNITNQDIHTDRDSLEKINFDHVLEHSKMVIGYAYELTFADF